METNGYHWLPSLSLLKMIFSRHVKMNSDCYFKTLIFKTIVFKKVSALSKSGAMETTGILYMQ